MKKIKKILLSMILSKQERVIIWNTLWFSNYTYRRRGDVDGAAAVQIVMNSTEYVLGVNKKNFTKEEVDQIVKDVLEASNKATSDVIGNIVNREFKKGYKAGKKAVGEEIEKYAEALVSSGESEKIDFNIVPGMKIDKEKCSSCEYKKECAVYEMIFGNSEEKEEAPKKEETPKKEEGTTEK